MHSDAGATPVGILADLNAVAAASVIYLRLWHDGAESQSKIWNQFAVTLGFAQGRKSLQAFDRFCALCALHGHRPMIKRTVNCHYLGSDWNSPLKVAHPLGYVYPYLRRSYGWVANERNRKTLY